MNKVDLDSIIEAVNNPITQYSVYEYDESGTETDCNTYFFNEYSNAIDRLLDEYFNSNDWDYLNNTYSLDGIDNNIPTLEYAFTNTTEEIKRMIYISVMDKEFNELKDLVKVVTYED